MHVCSPFNYKSCLTTKRGYLLLQIKLGTSLGPGAWKTSSLSSGYVYAFASSVCFKSPNNANYFLCRNIGRRISLRNQSCVHAAERKRRRGRGRYAWYLSPQLKSLHPSICQQSHGRRDSHRSCFIEESRTGGEAIFSPKRNMREKHADICGELLLFSPGELRHSSSGKRGRLPTASSQILLLWSIETCTFQLSQVMALDTGRAGIPYTCGNVGIAQLTSIFATVAMGKSISSGHGYSKSILFALHESIFN